MVDASSVPSDEQEVSEAITLSLGESRDRIYTPERIFRLRPLRSGTTELDIGVINCHYVPARGFGGNEVGTLWDRVVLTDLESSVLLALRIIAPDIDRISLIEDQASRERIALIRRIGIQTPESLMLSHPTTPPAAPSAKDRDTISSTCSNGTNSATPSTNGHAGPAASASDPAHVVVLGAGVCGLYAARVLVERGLRVTVLERGEVVGGLAAGRERGGNFYDFGVHQLHAFDREIFDDIRALMGERMIAVEKRALIRYGKGYRRYPLEFADLLGGIPPWTLAWAMAGLIAQQAVNRLRPITAVSAEDALIQLYGRPLYRFFFRDFTHRYWGIPPAELSATFVRQKMPRLSAVDVVKKALGRLGVKEAGAAAVESALAEETLYYSRSGAREMPLALADHIRARGGAIHLESPVTGIDAERDPATGRLAVRAVRYAQGDVTRTIACDACLSTIPLAVLVRALGQAAPDEVRAAAGHLRHLPVAVYGFLVKRPRVLDAQYVYYRNRSFHRLAEPKSCGMHVAPEDHTVLLAETTCEIGDDRWNGGEATRRRMIADMEAEGLLAADDIAEVHVFRDAFAYPVYALGFEPHLAQVEAFLAGFANLRSTGRQGAFCYPNMHGAMRLGAQAAEAIARELAEVGREAEQIGSEPAPIGRA